MVETIHNEQYNALICKFTILDSMVIWSPMTMIIIDHWISLNRVNGFLGIKVFVSVLGIPDKSLLFQLSKVKLIPELLNGN